VCLSVCVSVCVCLCLYVCVCLCVVCVCVSVYVSVCVGVADSGPEGSVPTSGHKRATLGRHSRSRDQNAQVLEAGLLGI
jgi:hypothetical protein